MNVDVVQNESKNRVTLEGRLDTKTSKDVEQAILKDLDANKDVSIDFTNVTYVSSAGLRVLLIVSKKLAANGKSMEISGVQPTIKEIFDISGFSDIFTIHAA